MRKISASVRLVCLMVVVLLAAIFAAGQAITFAWLSAFPEQSARLTLLETKFWIWAVTSVLLIAIDLGLLICVVQRPRHPR
jgi:hypothetical protein